MVSSRSSIQLVANPEGHDSARSWVRADADAQLGEEAPDSPALELPWTSRLAVFADASRTGRSHDGA